MFIHDDINKSKPFTFSSLPTANAYLFCLEFNFVNPGNHQLDITFDLDLMPSIADLLTPIR